MLYCVGAGVYAGELALSHITLNWWMERGYVTIERDSKPVKIPARTIPVLPRAEPGILAVGPAQAVSHVRPPEPYRPMRSKLH